MQDLPEVGKPFMFAKYRPVGGYYDEPREAVFWGVDSDSGIRAMKYLDEEGGMEFINPFQAHKYEAVNMN